MRGPLFCLRLSLGLLCVLLGEKGTFVSVMVILPRRADRKAYLVQQSYQIAVL